MENLFSGVWPEVLPFAKSGTHARECIPLVQAINHQGDLLVSQLTPLNPG